MLTTLLILFVLAVAIAPLAHFRPSKRQHRVARMREYAALNGLFVEFRRTPTHDSAPTAIRDVIYYGKRLPNARRREVESGTWVKGAAGWRSVGRRRPLPAPLRDLPVDIAAASVDQVSCGVYWTESSEEDAVAQIQHALERWSELLID